MPNFDGGHYFLTVFAPIRSGVVDTPGPSDRSHEQLLRQKLARIPTAQQTRITTESGKNSPFARNKRTHLARFAVFDDLAYNGRIPSAKLIGGENKLIPQHIDSLSCPYLLFAADFDAQTGNDSELDSYLGGLWSDMEPELRSIFTHCVGFENVISAGSFIDYIKQCQLETTMPFNDYWREMPPVSNAPFNQMFGILAVFGVAAPWILDHFISANDLVWWVKALASVVLLIGAAYVAIMQVGKRPFPTAPDSDLKSVLKALYLQQKFSEFVIKNQTADADALKANFGKFLEEHKPHDLDAPTQEPGVISSKQGGLS